MAKENKGVVVMRDSDENKIRVEADHPAALLATAFMEAGCTIHPRGMGYKVEDENGGRLGFVEVKKSKANIYLTTVSHDSEILTTLGVEARDSGRGTGIIDPLKTPEATLKLLRKIYKAKAAEEPAPRVKKPKKEKTTDTEAVPKVKKNKKSKKAATSEAPAEEPATTVRRKKKNKKAKVVEAPDADETTTDTDDSE